MAITRFTRARAIQVNAAGGTYTLDYTIPDGYEFEVRELFASSDTSAVVVELLYSSDGGSTWTNPWDEGSGHLLKLFLGAYIPASGKPDATWFSGSGENVLIRIKITNNHPTTNANIFWLVKAFERDNEN